MGATVTVPGCMTAEEYAACSGNPCEVCPAWFRRQAGEKCRRGPYSPKRVVLGPCPCHDCGEWVVYVKRYSDITPVWWNALRRGRHDCRIRPKAKHGIRYATEAERIAARRATYRRCKAKARRRAA